MITVLYTNSDAILACAGMTSEDVSDAFVTARALPKILSVDLYEWLPTHEDVYLSDGDSATTDERYKSDCLVLWCNYYAASRLLEAALTIKQRETDGKNEFERFTTPELGKLAEEAKRMAGVYRQKLLVALAQADVASPIQTMGLVVPNYDPVTG